MDPSTPLSLFLQGTALGFSAAATPGAFQTYLITQTLNGGWRRGLPVAFSPLISDPPIVIGILFLLHQIPDNFLKFIGLAGGFYVLYLAWGLWKQWRSQFQKDAYPVDLQTAQEIAPIPARQILFRGALMNVLSPGPYTFWILVLGPIVLAAMQASTLHALAFVMGFYLTFLGGMIALILLFHQAFRLGPRVVHSLTLVSILILVVFGGILIMQVFS